MSHILWDCPLARDVWGAKGSMFQKCSIHEVAFLHLEEQILSNFGMEKFGFFADLSRRIWLRRNDLIHGGVFTHPNLLVQGMLQAVEEYKQAHVLTPNVNQFEEPCGRKRWCAPPVGWLKANWDAAFDKPSAWIGIGVVVKDSNGAVVAARSLTQYGSVESLAGELLAACTVAQVCQELEGRPYISKEMHSMQ